MIVKVGKRIGQWGILNVSGKFPLFLKKKQAEKTFLAKISQLAAPLNGAPSINTKTRAFPSCLQRQDSKNTLCPLKKLKFSSLITRQKNSAAENLECDGPSTRRNFYTKIGWIQPIGAQKITLKEMKRRGMSRTEKKRDHFDVSLCE